MSAAARNPASFLLIFCIFINVCFPLYGQTAAEKKLKCVIAVFRHGDRSPIATYPNDKYKEDSWPDGFGQLTELGIQQHYELGRFMRNRYSGLLNETYKRHEFYVRSTDVDRTLMSAQANIGGLFQNTDNQYLHHNITWQLIPIHTMPQVEDYMLYMPRENCPRYNQLQNETYASKEFQQLISPYKDYLKSLQNITGYTAEKLNEPFTWWTIYDALLIEGIHNYTLPDWATQNVLEKLLRLSEISLASLYGIDNQQEKSRLMAGVLVKSILENITQATTNSSSLKLIMYSAHDTTVAALQTALNVSNGKIPPYASCHFFELYQDENGNYFIEMYYRNNSAVNPYPMTLPGCSQSCALEKFSDLLSSAAVQDRDKECGNVVSGDKCKGGIFSLTVAVVLLTIVVLGLIALFGCTRKRTTNYETV
ncbi:prostatic acid phosphatase [Hyperolius riggenbachi]|uniref:prostatic acid phosphatase n=1 Tax=Hyperolius riggenbachi TaxID=752182 RepID=UPI0035A399DA